MISITQKSDTEISIIFKKASQSIKEQATKAIINAFPENQNYLFEISGVDIDRFVEDMHSNKYLLKMDEKHRFIKNLPELLLFSNCFKAYGTAKKYFALVWMVEVPGKKRLEKPSLTAAIPSSSKVPLSESRSKTLNILLRSVFEKSIQPNCILRPLSVMFFVFTLS